MNEILSHVVRKNLHIVSLTRISETHFVREWATNAGTCNFKIGNAFGLDVNQVIVFIPSSNYILTQLHKTAFIFINYQCFNFNGFFAEAAI